MTGTRIILTPYLRSAKTRLRDGFLTTAMWILYGYFWLPFISLVAWFLGIDFAYEVMVNAGGAEALWSLMDWYGLAALFIIVMVSGWSAVQRIRFRDKNRRGLTPPVSDTAVREYSGLDEDDFRLLRTGRQLRVALDENGRMHSVQPAPGAVAA